MKKLAIPDILVAAGLAVGTLAAPSLADERKNWFDDPFVRLTSGIADCPVPEGPLMTLAESRTEGHVRSERGTRCYLEGRCRLPNSYQYDKGIMALVQKSVSGDARWKDTSVWALGQRRWIYLKGCVRSKQQSQDLERWVKGVDDVERVINELTIAK
ncbi:MAG TPA: BON domain-containing protein [Usitatibacter sp.]|nr:BON domain-containing protein [Usitatibacter sp.]